MIRCLGVAAVALAAATVAPAAQEPGTAFWDLATQHCLGPMEASQTPVSDGMKMSARAVAFIPSLSNTALAWESRDGEYFLSIERGARQMRCSAGFLAVRLRQDGAAHERVRAAFGAFLIGTLDRYTAVERRMEDDRLTVRLVSTDWRTPRMELVFVSDPKGARLYLLVREIGAGEVSG